MEKMENIEKMKSVQNERPLCWVCIIIQIMAIGFQTLPVECC